MFQTVGRLSLSDFGYNACTISQAGARIGVRVNIDDGISILDGHSHLVKDQRQIGDFVEMINCLINHVI